MTHRESRRCCVKPSFSATQPHRRVCRQHSEVKVASAAARHAQPAALSGIGSLIKTENEVRLTNTFVAHGEAAPSACLPGSARPPEIPAREPQRRIQPDDIVHQFLVLHELGELFPWHIRCRYSSSLQQHDAPRQAPLAPDLAGLFQLVQVPDHHGR